MFDVKNLKTRQISRRKMLLGAVAASAINAPAVVLMEPGTAKAQSAALQFATVTAMIANPSNALTDQQTATVANYATSTDLGGGTFVWNASCTAAHDGGVVICPSDRLWAVGNLFLHAGNGVATGYAGTFAHISVQPHTVAIYAGAVTARDNGSGTLFGPGVYGTINYTTGAWTLIYTTPPASTASLTTNYQYTTSSGRWVRQFSSTMNLQAFGPNGFNAWYLVFSQPVGSFSVLEVSSGTYNINRATFAGAGTLLMVPNGLTIQFDAGALVKFDYLETPLFCFWNNTSGGMTGGSFRYTGGTPNYLSPSVSKTQLYSLIGFQAAGLSTGQLCDLYALVYSNSSNMLFTGWDVESATPNNETNILPTILYMHPTTRTTAATNNTVSNMTWRDFQQGWLGFGQSGLTVNGINSDRRAGLHLMSGSTAYGPGPGHLIYANNTNNFGGLQMTNCTFENLYDGPNPINYGVDWLYNGHTLSPKSIGSGCVFNGVVSQHPVGIWSGESVANCTVENFTWQSTDTSCYSSLNYGFLMNSSGQILTANNNTFSNFTVDVPNKLFQFASDSGIAFNSNTLSGFDVTCNTAIRNGPGILDFTGNNNTVSSISITPTANGGLSGMSAFALRGPTSTGNSGEIVVIGLESGPCLARFCPSSNPVTYPNNVTVTEQNS